MKKVKTPWPTKKVMQQIYELQFWGKNEGTFYSGDGSHNPDIILPYLDALKSFLKTNPNISSILDLGCGDFNIGRNLYPLVNQYIAADIVPELIAHLDSQYKSPHLSFEVLDLAEDPLPKTDLLILRQVLQHLSNTEILAFLPKLKQYQYLLLTEHLPVDDFEPNLDIISGRNIRIKQNSGVDLLSPPFNLKVQNIHLLCEVSCTQYGGVIRTYLFEVR